MFLYLLYIYNLFFYTTHLSCVGLGIFLLYLCTSRYKIELLCEIPKSISIASYVEQTNYIYVFYKV